MSVFDHKIGILYETWEVENLIYTLRYIKRKNQLNTAARILEFIHDEEFKLPNSGTMGSPLSIVFTVLNGSSVSHIIIPIQSPHDNCYVNKKDNGIVIQIKGENNKSLCFIPYKTPQQVIWLTKGYKYV